VGEILLVEDNAGDIVLFKELLFDGEGSARLAVVRNGEEALEYLRQRGVYAAAPRPSLILLDLNLPKKDGCELLTELKADVSLRRIPVAVLTSSSSDEDVNRVYDAHANCCVTKPMDLERMTEVVKSIERFWLHTATLPCRDVMR
jgi:chemotaxis family two-component system response regulator Rcp1